MAVYEPELMYALDSKGEYADWKNVYNVSGSDVLYCPICLGRVKLWNGQDPNKIYKKQRCFHHIDGICSQESRIHFAYKTWLLEKGSKFKVEETVYEVYKSEIEKTYHTKFGDYRPDITVKTTDGKLFYIEIANTNKKTNSYIEKWDELGCDVLELDVNEQLSKISVNNMPELKTIYSYATGISCVQNYYIKQDYNEVVFELSKHWNRYDMMTRKALWEKFDWFWKTLRDYFSGDITIEKVCETYKAIDNFGKHFIYTRFRSSKKHKELKENFKNIINAEFIDHIDEISENIPLKEKFILKHSIHSKTIYKITIIRNSPIPNSSLNLILYEKKIRKHQDVWNLDDVKIESIVLKSYKIYDEIKEKLIKLENILTYNKYVYYYSYCVKKRCYGGYYYSSLLLDDEYTYYDYLYIGICFNFNKLFLENNTHIEYIPIQEVDTDRIEKLYMESYDNEFNSFLSSKLYKYVLSNDIEFNQVLDYLKELCSRKKMFSYGTSNDLRKLCIYHSNQKIFSWNYNDKMIFGKFEKELMETIKILINDKLNEINFNKNKKAKITRCLNKYIEKINNCSNKMWKIKVNSKKKWIIELLGYECWYSPVLEEIPDDNIENFIKCKIIEMMTFLLDSLKTTKPLKDTDGYCCYPDVRIMEDR